MPHRHHKLFFVALCHNFPTIQLIRRRQLRRDMFKTQPAKFHKRSLKQTSLRLEPEKNCGAPKEIFKFGSFMAVSGGTVSTCLNSWIKLGGFNIVQTFLYMSHFPQKNRMIILHPSKKYLRWCRRTSKTRCLEIRWGDVQKWETVTIT